RSLSHVGSGESARRDSGDGEWLAIEVERPADYVGITAKPAPPKTVAQDGDRPSGASRTRLAIVVHFDRRPDRHGNSKCGKVITGDDLARDPLRRAVDTQAHRK